MNKISSSENEPSLRKGLQGLKRIIPLVSLMAILGGSTEATEPVRLPQTFELKTPASVNYYLFTQGVIQDARNDVASLTRDHWATINDLRENDRKLQYLHNTFLSWARLQGLVDEKKMIIEIKKTPT
ncbi:hypothetical protein H6768_00250 [Candidatus Peribacteria bacterium]|nr:hypothetical protein [Candidatus Peribacteria bacterium]